MPTQEPCQEYKVLRCPSYPVIPVLRIALLFGRPRRTPHGLFAFLAALTTTFSALAGGGRCRLHAHSQAASRLGVFSGAQSWIGRETG
jgi:hypothetical protein